MRQFTSLMSGFGAAGAAANAKAELETAHTQRLQAALVAKRVNQRSGAASVPLTPATGRRAA